MNQARQLVGATPQPCHRGSPVVDGRRDCYVRCCRLSHENVEDDLKLKYGILINLCVVAKSPASRIVSVSARRSSSSTDRCDVRMSRPQRRNAINSATESVRHYRLRRRQRSFHFFWPRTAPDQLNESIHPATRDVSVDRSRIQYSL